MNQNFIEDFQFLVKQQIKLRNEKEEQKSKVRNTFLPNQMLEQFLLENRDIRLSTLLKIADEFGIELSCKSK